MTAHPKAALLAELAEVAATNEKPWEEFETRNKKFGPTWFTQSSLAQLLSCIVSSDFEIRRKPRTIKIGDRTIHESLRAERAVSERLLEGIQKAIDRTKPILGVPDRASHIVAPLYAAIDEVESLRAKEQHL